MAQQVKFYAVGPSDAKSNENGIYFVDGGELYKGTSRFGLGRVTTVEDTTTLTSAARGDINIYEGTTKVFDGTNWLVAAEAFSLPTLDTGDNDGEVKLGEDAAKVSGWDALTGRVSAIEGIVDASTSTVTAGTGNFTNLNVSGTAAFDATTVTASTLAVTGSAGDFTVDNKTIPDYIADAIGDLSSATVSGSANGIQVGVTTQSGAVTSVTVAAADIEATSVSAASGTFTNLNVTDTATFSATTVSADTLTIGGSTVEQLADKQIAAIAESTVVSASNGITVSVTTQGGSVTAVTLNAEAFGNAIHFRGVEASTGAVSDPEAGDIVVIGSTPATGFVAGQEYIYDGTNWELIGDQNTYALNAYSSTATVYAGVETVPAALNAAGAAIDALTSKTDAYVGGSASDADQGVAVTVSIDAATLAPSVDVVVTSSTLFAGLDASVSSSENSSIQVGVTQVDGVVTGVTADLLWLDASGAPIA